MAPPRPSSRGAPANPEQLFYRLFSSNTIELLEHNEAIRQPLEYVWIQLSLRCPPAAVAINNTTKRFFLFWFKITSVTTEGGNTFSILRDDLTHPYIGGNKRRKLDGLWPDLQCCTDLVTCGGVQRWAAFHSLILR